MYTQTVTALDWLLLPFYLLVIYFIASNIQKRNIVRNPIYKYYLSGLFVKIGGALALCFIYLYYYKSGGDTLNYHQSSNAIVNLFFADPDVFFHVLFGASTPENYSNFTMETGFPMYWHDYHAMNVVKLITPIELVAFKSYFITSALMGVLSFTGIWKLYELFCELYPQMYKKFALAILFIPSVVFWGSGILKDSWTIAATGWFCFSFYRIFIVRKSLLYYTFLILISAFLLIIIKPYIFVALMPGCLIWGTWHRIIKIKNLILRFLFVPFILTVGIGGGLFLWFSVSSSLGEYSSIDSMIKKASVASDDLKQEYYQGNSFDLGSYDPTVSGVLSKFPIATMTGLFRPFLWETKNIMMVLSGLENFALLLFFINIFIRNPASSFAKLFSNPLLLFCILFAVFFAFSVAISTSNFGAMVRLRIPLLPFFVSGLFIIKYGDERVSEVARQ